MITDHLNEVPPRWDAPQVVCCLALVCGFAFSAAAFGRTAGEPGLETALHTIVQEQGIPGAVAAAIMPDGTEWVAAAGWADREANRPMAPEDRMLAASIGKTFVAATAMQLAAEGSVDLDGSLARWLGRRPWFDRLPNGRRITPRMLLNHSSGLVDYVYQPGFLESRLNATDPDWYMPHEDKIGLILDQAPLFKPGGGYQYTDSEYILLGLIIEEAAGRRYYDLLDEYFLEPLDLSLTSPSHRRQLQGLVPGYMADNDPFSAAGFPDRVMSDGALIYNPASEWTGGGVVTNPRDLARWAVALYQERAVPGAYLDELLRPGVEVPLDAPWKHYGLGVMVFETPHGPLWGHWGNMPGYSGLMVYAPRQRFAFAVLANVTIFDTGRAQNQLFEFLLAHTGPSHPTDAKSAK
jgi:D-alanyl-D-alanine carboxypeptidase